MSFTLLETSVVGLEDFQRAAFYVFFEGMNNALAVIEAYWQPRDQTFNDRTGRDIPPTTLEPFPNDNFHEGHRPSLVNGTPENYPNLTVFATQAVPSPFDQGLDVEDSWIETLLVEVMVKGSNEEETNRRIQRATEAAVMCIRRNMGLGGATDGYTAAPSVVISDLFAVRSISQGGAYPGEKGSGARYLWQGSQITFRVQKESVQQPSDGSDTFAKASTVDYSAQIDQG
jgi:hypothetical protein